MRRLHHLVGEYEIGFRSIAGHRLYLVVNDYTRNVCFRDGTCQLNEHYH